MSGTVSGGASTTAGSGGGAASTPASTAPSPADDRASALQAAAVAAGDKLQAAVDKLAPTLGADDLSALNAALTELRAVAPLTPTTQPPASTVSGA